MVNNSANINKTSNHLSSHPTEHNNIPGHMMLEMKDLAWDKHNNVAGLNMSILLCESLFDMCEILNGATLVWLRRVLPQIFLNIHMLQFCQCSIAVCNCEQYCSF